MPAVRATLASKAGKWHKLLLGYRPFCSVAVRELLGAHLGLEDRGSGGAWAVWITGSLEPDPRGGGGHLNCAAVPVPEQGLQPGTRFRVFTGAGLDEREAAPLSCSRVR